VSLRQPGIVAFDAEISADGNVLFVADGRFTGGPVPETADIDVAVREGAGFRQHPSGRESLRNVNAGALEYAAAVSGDLPELFLTRPYRSGGSPQTLILRAVRDSRDAPFGPPPRISSITGFVEAPTLSNDGRALYYRKLESGRFVIYPVAR
jgi:hypothetical protein